MYSFMTRSEMECDIKNGRFLEHGEYDGNLYGTKINSIHEVIETGKICILDVNPQVEETHIYSHLYFCKILCSNQLCTAGCFWSIFRRSTSSIFIKKDLLMITITRLKHSANLIYAHKLDKFVRWRSCSCILITFSALWLHESFSHSHCLLCSDAEIVIHLLHVCFFFFFFF